MLGVKVFKEQFLYLWLFSHIHLQEIRYIYIHVHNCLTIKLNGTQIDWKHQLNIDQFCKFYHDVLERWRIIIIGVIVIQNLEIGHN